MKKDKGQPGHTVICRNRQAAMRFELLEKVECGIVLCGTEVKSLRAGRASLDDAFARPQDGALWLCGLHIPVYAPAADRNHEPLRVRKLLLHRRELTKIDQRVQQKGLTLVPLSAYFNERGLVKISLAIARGKATHDKRQTLKDREHKREMERSVRSRR